MFFLTMDVFHNQPRPRRDRAIPVLFRRPGYSKSRLAPAWADILSLEPPGGRNR